MNMGQYEAVEFTHVRYQKGDHLGYFLAWVSLVPVFMSETGFLSHLIFRREIQGIFFALGHVISMFTINFIKDSVQQARPETCVLLEICHTHGWPSNHSQVTFFFAVYLTLLTTYKGHIGLCKWVVATLAWCLAILTMYSRVYLGYHTVGQVFAGAVFGTLFGGIWFWVVNSLLFPYFPAIENSKLGRMFYFKDTSHIPNVLKFEYQKARAAREARKLMKS